MEISVILDFFKSLLKISISGSARVRNPGYGELVLSGACSSPGCELRQWLYLNTSPMQEVLLSLFTNEKIETQSS